MVAHSDIFLCGQSNDAMLATGVYSVITEKKGVVKHFFLSNSTYKQTSLYHWLGPSHWCKTCQIKGICLCNTPSSGGEKCIQLKPRMDNNQLSKTNTNLRGNCKGSSLPLLLLPHPLSPCSLLYPIDSTFLPSPLKAISRSHTWTYINVTATQSTQQACLWETSGPHWHFPVQL